MRRLPALLLVLLVLSSGCAEFLPWSDSGSNRTTSTTSSGELSSPPGANSQWIFDAEQLVSAHESALESENYRVNVRVRPNQSAGPTEWENMTVTAHVGDGHVLMRGEGGQLGPQGLVEPYRSYSSDDTTAWCRRAAERCHYSSGAPTRSQQVIKSITPRIESILASSDFVANGTTVHNGTRMYRYDANGSTTLPDVHALSATVLVDEDGLIHDLSGTVRTTGERPTTAEFDYGFSLASHPPAKPSWMDGLPRLTVRVNASEFTLEHESGERLRSGTNVSLFLANNTATAVGTVQLSKSLGRGDVAHITITDIEDTERRQYNAVGNVTIDRPSTGEPGINHTNWSPTFRYQTKHWSVNVRANPEGENHITTTTTNTTTTAA